MISVREMPAIIVWYKKTDNEENEYDSYWLTTIIDNSEEKCDDDEDMYEGKYCSMERETVEENIM